MMSTQYRSRRGRRTTIVTSALAAVFLGALFAAPAAVAEPTSGGPQTWTVHAGEQSASGAIQGMAFLPGEIWIHTGDTVHWVASSMEIHTVSFIDAAHPSTGFDPSIGYMVTQTPETTIDAPGEFRNSGVLDTLSDPTLPPQFRSYDLTFTGPGDYTYSCYVHGTAMSGTVHVQTGGRLPHTQRFYDQEYRSGKAAIIADGQRLIDRARDASSSHHVFVGPSDAMALIMRFERSKVTIHAGESVVFDSGMDTAGEPHTVTIGQEPPAPFITVGDPTNYRLGQDLNSGVLEPAFIQPPGTFTVTFKDPGTYHYFCMFHDMMGMTGTVIVLPPGHDD
jgi:plastocyanin